MTTKQVAQELSNRIWDTYPDRETLELCDFHLDGEKGKSYYIAFDMRSETMQFDEFDNDENDDPIGDGHPAPKNLFDEIYNNIVDLDEVAKTYAEEYEAARDMENHIAYLWDHR